MQTDIYIYKYTDRWRSKHQAAFDAAKAKQHQGAEASL